MHQFDPNKVTYFARTDARGKNIQFGIKAKDRQRHVYVIGKTGMGKSTLLENMAAQDLQNGEGMAFIDPHGSAAEKLLNYIPEHRKDDVVYFAPFDMGYPISFNIMEDVGPDRRHLVVSGLMSVFEKIWVDAWSARMAYILQNTLMALLEYPDSTLLGVNRMLSDKEYRKRVVDNVKDPGVKAFWVDEFAKYNERYMQEAGDAIKNKIGQFTANPVIRNIIGQPKSSFDIRKIMDEQKIIIMNLSKGLIGETNANLLGSMLTTRIYLAAMSRADLSPEKMATMPNFYFYVDEFQSFANATFANILSEARKYHLNLTIAHQYIEQMEEDVRNAVFGNVGTIISFRVGPFDAEVLETIFAPQFTATDIVNLSFAQVYLTLMIDGIGSQPFSATTLPPIAPPSISCKDMAIAASRRQFARPRDEVEIVVQKFHEPIVPEKPQRSNDMNGNMNGNGNNRKGNGNKKQTGNGSKFSDARNGGGPRLNGETMQNNADSEPYEIVSHENDAAGWVEEIPEPSPEVQKPQGEPTPSQLMPSPQNPKQHHDRPKKNHAENGRPQKHPRPENNLSDLRSVLRRIVDEEKSKEEKKSNTEKEQLEKNKDASREDLRNTLSSVLAQAIPQQSVATTEPAMKKAEVETAVTPPESVLTESHTPTSSPEHRTQHGASTETNGDNNTKQRSLKKPNITPKELERMMRITTSDTPPFK